MSFRELLVWVRARPPKGGRETHMVAVDGHGGSGKSTFATRLAAGGDRVDVVHTDDFALSGETAGMDIVRLCEQVLAPLERDEAARYQRFDWDSQQLMEWVDVRPGGLVVLEGVSSMRREFTVPWDLTVWVETPRDLCLARGLERDGAGAQHLWDRWLAQEDEYISRDEPHMRADLVVAGAPDDAPRDPACSLVVLRDLRRAQG